MRQGAKLPKCKALAAMAASTFHEYVELADEQLARLAPFPVLTRVRQRSSSLVAPIQSTNAPTRELVGPLPLPDATHELEGDDMPGILSNLKGLHRRASFAEAPSPSTTATPGKMKITDKGRERRLSAAAGGKAVLRHLRAGAPSSSTSGGGEGANLSSTRTSTATFSTTASSGVVEASEITSTTRPPDLAASAATDHFPPSSSRASATASPRSGDRFQASVAAGGDEQSEEGQKSMLPLAYDLDNDSPSSSDTSITQQRARAYAALTGGALPSTRRTKASTRSTTAGQESSDPIDSHKLDLLARASFSQPSLPTHLEDHDHQALSMGALERPAAQSRSTDATSPLLSPSSPLGRTAATPRRRTTSNTDSPSLSPLTTPHAAKTARRSRVQSASAVPGPVLNRLSPTRPGHGLRHKASSPISPSDGAAPMVRNKRRSLSQENSLVATRIARAFLVRELGETAVERRPAAAQAHTPSHWHSDDTEQRDLWLALHDGVLLCRLLNQINSGSIDNVDKRDLASAKEANILQFVQAAKRDLPLQPHEFFEADALFSGSPTGFERVLHTICAIAEYVSLKQHGLFQSTPPELPHPSPNLGLPSPSPLVHAPFEPRSQEVTSQKTRHQMRASTGDLQVPSIGTSTAPTVSPRLSSPPTDSRTRQSAPIASNEGNASNILRPSRLVSANGIKIRSRTTSKPSAVSSPLPAQSRHNSFEPSTAPILPTSDVHSSRSSKPDELAPLSDRDQVTATPPSSLDTPRRSVHPHQPFYQISHHPVYGANADRRMSESAVEIMTVVREGEETPQARRAASDRPNSRDEARGGGLLASSTDCTPVKRAQERGYFAARRSVGGGILSDSDTSSSSDVTSELGMLSSSAGRGLRLRQSAPASAAGIKGDLLPLRGNSPRIMRKRLSADRPIPTRAKSASPPPVDSDHGSPTVPFPQAAPPLVRAKTAVVYRELGYGSELAPLEEGNSATDASSPSSSLHHIDGPPPEQRFVHAESRPRQHKRFYSEVFDQPSGGARARQDAAQSRTRHNSFMPTSTSGSDLLEGAVSPRPVGELRRRATDNRRQSLESSRQRIVVKEAGKSAITYQLGECIGRGQFGSVYRALNIHTGSVVAVKRIRLAGKSEDEIVQLQKEVDLLKRLSHPSVVKYEGLVRSDNYLNIVMEYVENGSLHNTLSAFGILPESLVASYVVKILEGLAYLHSMQVIHRDLKAANILTTKKGNIKLSDFGVSLQLTAVHNTLENADATGTPNWMAPEVIKLEKSTYASDIWSLACTIVELTTGKPPYANLLPMTAMFKIVEDDCPPIPKGCSPELDDFLQLCFAKEPDLRPTAEALFEHEWLRKHWQSHKHTLRPQDSIPFFRRISSEYRGPDLPYQEVSASSDQVPDLSRSVSSPGHSSLMKDDLAESLRSEADDVTIVEALECRPSIVSTSVGNLPIPDLDMITSEMLRQGKEISTPNSVMASSVPSAFPFPSVDIYAHGKAVPISPPIGPSHTFVKTTFSKPIECKICHKPVKKYAVLCEDCGLICHATCKEFAPSPCDLRSQLLGVSIPPSFSTQQMSNALSPPLASSAPIVESSPLTSPAQFAFHSKFGIGKGRKPKGSPSSDILPSPVESSQALTSPESPQRGNRAFNLLRTRTSSPDAVGFHYHRDRPASFASSGNSGSFPRSHDPQASLSGSSDSHPLSASSIPGDGSPVSPLPVAWNPPSRQQLAAPAMLGKNQKLGRTKSSKRQGGSDCLVS